MIEIGHRFWNIRGTFRVAGVVNVGTQASLVQRANGRFLLLDSYRFDDEVAETIDAYTDGGKAIEAILNLHPFHTVFVPHVHERYPDAALYGSRRHHEKHPDLPWQALTVDDPELHALFAEDLEFTVPEGVDFISANNHVHFSSVLAYHAASNTIHSNDTFNYVPANGLLGLTPLADTLSFHPTLAKALQRRPGAAQEFHAWAMAMIESWREAQNLCAAHTAPLLAAENRGDTVHERMLMALEKVKGTLMKHEDRYG